MNVQIKIHDKLIRKFGYSNKFVTPWSGVFSQNASRVVTAFERELVACRKSCKRQTVQMDGTDGWKQSFKRHFRC